MLFYNTRHGEKILFSEHYVDLLLVDGHQGLEMKRHEVLAFGHQRLQQRSAAQRKIAPAELFVVEDGRRPVRRLLVTGVAGIGKTILVQKMLFDFGGGNDDLGFDFVLHMTFRDLNLISKPTNLRDMVLRKNRHLVKELDAIFANQEKLLIVLDGLDEFQHYRSCDAGVFVSEPDEDAEVPEIVGSLMQGELLPNASVMLTCRPSAAGHVPVGCVDRFVLVAGFSLPDVREFFRRYFQDEAVAEETFAAASANELMLTLCYIPAFCYIVCCILKESKDLRGETPKTMTDIYVHYLVALLRSHTQARAEAFPDFLLKLGRLGFRKLMEHQTLFYGSDRDVAALAGNDLLSTFLDKTVVQEAGCTEDVYSFAHLTVQEFFAALFYAMSDHPLPAARVGEAADAGHLDLFYRFLSGILSERNAGLLLRQAGLRCHRGKADAHRRRMVGGITALCQNGANVLNHLQCLFEQQDPSLALAVQPERIRINVSDQTLSQMDYNAIKYFLNLKTGEIEELDLTGTGVGWEALRDIRPLLLRCQSLWLGENNLDMESVQVIASVLRESDSIIHLGIGWSNVGDDGLLALSDAIRMKKRLQELWMEGNHVSYRGLLSLRDLSPRPLKKVVAIWNDLPDTGALCRDPAEEGFVVGFTDDEMWESWGEWVFKRCQVSSNEKLVTVLHKVCNISAHCLEAQWAKNFYGDLSRLVQRRIECCTEEDVCKRLKRFEDILNL